MKDFVGSKIALLYGDQLVVCLRDNKPGLRFANMYDFPGGGREGNETPTEVAIREVDEELGIKLSPESILWQKEYPAMHDENLRAYFLVAKVKKEDIDSIKFGEEGQRWELMDVNSFLNHNNVVPALKGRLSDYLAVNKA